MQHPVATLCRVLGVSPSGFWAWQERAPSAHALEDERLGTLIAEIHRDSRETYGVPRVHAELRDRGVRCSRKRIARLMRQRRLAGVHRRRFTVTTKRAAGVAPAADLVARNFTATAPNQTWVADITYVHTWAGFLYVAVVLDVFSRRIVGWAMSESLATEVVLNALDMAVWNRRPGSGVVHHSDQGCQGGFNRSLQHQWLLTLSTITQSAPRLVSATRVSCEAAHSAWPRRHRDPRGCDD